ncbi:thiol-disulfide oxidoreductase DCC family protein [Bacteroides sp.]|uniref:thiol-disulfide oxidoreductase DCC family protein n=1 Tax=Bacteroides sp. TaxID=29523 RepID=UPI00260CB564|nr:DUF393 domain-containing protein [Bacteroides sp.]
MNIILFDGACNLCSNTISFISKRDKKALFRFIAIQSETGKALLQKYNATQEQATTLFYIRNDHCLKRSTAILYILKDLGGIWKCFYPFIYLPVQMRDAFYSLLSRNRYRLFGKKNECTL